MELNSLLENKTKDKDSLNSDSDSDSSSQYIKIKYSNKYLNIIFSLLFLTIISIQIFTLLYIFYFTQQLEKVSKKIDFNEINNDIDFIGQFKKYNITLAVEYLYKGRSIIDYICNGYIKC